MDTVLVLWALSLVTAVVCAYVGALLGRQRTVGSWGGFFLGLFLGPLGLLVAILFPRRTVV